MIIPRAILYQIKKNLEKSRRSFFFINQGNQRKNLLHLHLHPKDGSSKIKKVV
jgi:hypothetical protein